MHFQTLAQVTGCELTHLSAKYWNAYEEYPQFGGPSFVVKQGIGTLLSKMAANLDVQFNKQVMSG